MTFQPYTLDQTAAKKATEGGRIDETGKYIVKIVRAEFIRAKTGTEGMEFEVETASKETAIFSIYTRKTDGTTLRGFDYLNALMVVTKSKTLTPVQQKVTKYDFDAKERREFVVTVAQELMGQTVGMLLLKEYYQTDKGDWRHRITLFCPFDAQTEMVAAEILNRQTQPKELAKLVNRLEAASAKEQEKTANARKGQDDSLDDVPFAAAASYPRHADGSPRHTPATAPAVPEDDLPF